MSELYERVAVLPTPTEELEDTIYKYAGSTTDNYTRGNYYKCVLKTDRASNNLQSLASQWINNTIYVVHYSVGGTPNYIYLNGVTASKTGYLNPGDKIYAHHTSFESSPISLDWYSWEQVEIDEHNTKKKFSQANWTYLFSEYAQRFNEEV